MVWSHPINDSLLENVCAGLIVALLFLLAGLLVAAVTIAWFQFVPWAAARVEGLVRKAVSA